MNDMQEKHDMSAAHPEIVKQLNDTLYTKYMSRNITSQKGQKDPAGVAYAKKHGGVWTPWRGDPIPAHCDTNKTGGQAPSPAPRPHPPKRGPFHSSIGPSSPPPSSDSSQFPSTCSSLPLLFGRSNLDVNLPSCVKSTHRIHV